MKRNLIIIPILVMCSIASLYAQDKAQDKTTDNDEHSNKLTISGNLGFVSDFIWRGMDQESGASFQPEMTIGWKGLSLSLWGNQSLANRPYKEIDITLDYSIGGLSLSLTDMWWGGVDAPYGYYRRGPEDNPVDGAHHLEGTVYYSFAETLNFPLALSWSTWVAGADVEGAKGGRAFSSYCTVECPLQCPFDVMFTTSVGLTPWAGYYHSGFGVTDITFTAEREFNLTQSLSLPVFVRAVVSPISDRVYLVGGVSLNL